MSFLYPSFLFGLFAISIPIIIHLFNFQKPKKVLFTSINFLKLVKENTSTRLKLKHLLILLSRICFIIFLVLAFAQPFIQSKKASDLKGSQMVSIYTDNSFSMESDLEEGKALDIALKSAESVTGLFSPDTRYMLLTNDFEGKDEFFRDKEKISERITEIHSSAVFRDLRSVYLREQQAGKRENGNGQKIFWFSDFQKSTIGDLSKVVPDSSDQVYLIPVQNKNAGNVFIDSVWLNAPFLKQQENNTIEVQVYNDGAKDVKDLSLKFYMENVQISATSIDIAAHSKSRAKFVFNISSEGQKRCKITFEDYPIAFDNEFYFVLNVSPKIKILHLYEEENVYVSNVFTNEDIFSLNRQNVGQLDYSLIPVSNLVVLDELKIIPANVTEALRIFVKNGGSVLFIPAVKADQTSYEGFFRSLTLPKVSFITPDTASSQKINSELLPPDISNPFFRNIFEKNGNNKIQMPYAFSRLEWQGKGQNLLNFKNRSSFLSLFEMEKGKIYLQSSPDAGAYTNFFKHSVFVPVMYKIAFNSISESERLSYSLQENSVSIDLDNNEAQQIYTLKSGKLKIIPPQSISGRRLMMEIPRQEMKAGIYELVSGDTIKRVLAFNYGKEESYLESYSSDELKKAFSGYKNVSIYDAQSSAAFLAEFKKDNIGIPLWKYCVILSLLFLLVEILLIRFL
ncbi:MAG: BatA domain-containing protein [Cytophagaceae bacterium]